MPGDPPELQLAAKKHEMVLSVVVGLPHTGNYELWQHGTLKLVEQPKRKGFN
jgi:hypothetical protein